MTLRFDLPLSADAYPLVRFRPGKSNNSAQYRTCSGALSPAGKYAADVPGKMAARGEICFQPGLVYRTITIYDPWVCLPRSSASAK